MARGRPKLGADEATAAAERRRVQAAERMRRMRERRRAEVAAVPPEPPPTPPPAEVIPASTPKGGIGGHYLRLYVEQIERLEEEARGPGLHADDKRYLQEDIKKVYAEAKASGFDVAVLREVIRIRRMGQEQQQKLPLYLDVLDTSAG